MREPIAADIKSFAGAHPGLNADFLRNTCELPGRDSTGRPPRLPFVSARVNYSACVEFDSPDARSEASWSGSGLLK